MYFLIRMNVKGTYFLFAPARIKLFRSEQELIHSVLNTITKNIGFIVVHILHIIVHDSHIYLHIFCRTNNYYKLFVQFGQKSHFFFLLFDSHINIDKNIWLIPRRVPFLLKVKRLFAEYT